MNTQRSTRSRRAGISFLVLACLLGLQIIAGVNAAPGEALVYSRATIVVGMTLPGGPGHPAPVKAVVWKNGGAKGFCIEFGMDWPTSAGIRKLASGDRVPGMGAAASAKAKWIANKYATTNKRMSAAAAALAIWSLEGSSRFDTWWAWVTKKDRVAPAIQAEVARILSEAALYASLKITLIGEPVDYLETGIATIKVSGADGPAPGRAVELAHTGVRLLSAPSRTDAKGEITVSYQRTTPSGEVSLVASIDTPSTRTAGVSNSSPGHQMTLSGGFAEVKRATLGYTRTLGAPTATTNCDTSCNGTAPVSFEVCNPDLASALRYPISNQEGRIVATLDVPAGACARKELIAADRSQLVVNRYCHVSSPGGPCTTAYVKVKEVRITVDCPAWASAEVTLGCNCAESWSKVVFSVPAHSPGHYEGIVTFSEASGLEPQTVKLTPGEATTVTIPQTIPAGTVISAGFEIRNEEGQVTKSKTLVMLQVMQ